MKYGGVEYPDRIYCPTCKELRDVKDHLPTVKLTKEWKQLAFFRCPKCNVRIIVPHPKKARPATPQ